jgi:hypothetical protein
MNGKISRINNRIKNGLKAAFVCAVIPIMLSACWEDLEEISGKMGERGPAAEITIAAIDGVTAPVLGAIPVTTIAETSQYTGTVTWDGGWTWSPRFGGLKAYTATITLTAKSGYTLVGVAENFFTVAGVTSPTNPTDSGVVTALFPQTASIGAIGDSALGGKVAYILQNPDTGYIPGEQRGLIAATADQSTGIIWAVAAYQSTAVPGGTQTALGTGRLNTDKIIAQNGAGLTYAAGLARAYTGGGYNDWFLPSQDELSKLYDNRLAVGGFVDNFYWSSSEDDDFLAWTLYFSNDSQYNGDKYNLERVRAVRAF